MKMKTKMLAIMAVLAIAFAGIAVFGFAGEQSDAADPAITPGAASYTLDGVESDLVVPVTVSGFPLPGTTIVITMASSDGTVIESNDTGISVKNNGTFLFTVPLIKAGAANLTFTATQGTTVANSTAVAVTINPIMTLGTERINVTTGDGFDFKINTSGYAGDTTTAINFTHVAGQNLITLPTGKTVDGDNAVTVSSGALDVATDGNVWEIVKVKIGENGPDQDVMIMYQAYDAYADGAIKTYAETLSGDAIQSQAIFYSDGSALLNLSRIDMKTEQNLKITVTYTVTEDTAEYKYSTVITTAAKAYVPIDIPFFIDFDKVGKTVLEVKGFDSDTVLTTITADKLPAYELHLDINYEGGVFKDSESAEVASPYTPAGADLKRNADLKIKTIERDGYSFAGFAFQNDAKEGIAYDATQKIEWLVFTYGNGSEVADPQPVYNPAAHSIYAVWAKKIYNVYVDYDGDNKIFIPGTKIDSANGFKFTAPAIAYTDDYVLVRVAQIGALSENTYTLNIFEVLYDKDTHEYSKGTEKTASLNVTMLANGIYTFTNLTCDVVVEVTKTVSTTQKMVGFGFDIQSAQTNDAGTKGKVMMQFDVRDIVPAGEITLKGTYFRVDSVTGQRVYGNVDNLDAATYFTTSVSKNFGDYSAAAAGSVVEIDDTAVDYSIVFGSTNIGLYAVQGQYVNGATYTTGWTLAEKAEL